MRAAMPIGDNNIAKKDEDAARIGLVAAPASFQSERPAVRMILPWVGRPPPDLAASDGLRDEAYQRLEVCRRTQVPPLPLTDARHWSSVPYMQWRCPWILEHHWWFAWAFPGVAKVISPKITAQLLAKMNFRILRSSSFNRASWSFILALTVAFDLP
jgi:hypothetical protein